MKNKINVTKLLDGALSDKFINKDKFTSLQGILSSTYSRLTRGVNSSRVFSEIEISNHRRTFSKNDYYAKANEALEFILQTKILNEDERHSLEILINPSLFDYEKTNLDFRLEKEQEYIDADDELEQRAKQRLEQLDEFIEAMQDEKHVINSFLALGI